MIVLHKDGLTYPIGKDVCAECFREEATSITVLARREQQNISDL
jgi:hypothetical protein